MSALVYHYFKFNHCFKLGKSYDGRIKNLLRKSLTLLAGVVMNGPYGTLPIERKPSLVKEIKSKMPKMGIEFEPSLLGDRAKDILIWTIRGTENRGAFIQKIREC